MSKHHNESPPWIEILGVHPLTVTDEMVTEQAEILYGAPDKDSRKLARAQLESAVLIEALIHDPDDRLNVGDFKQRLKKDPDSDQVAWNEHFLSPDGNALAADPPYKKPAIGPLWRIAFFLHYFEPGAPLETTYGPLKMPPTSKMPERIRKLVPYEYLD